MFSSGPLTSPSRCSVCPRTEQLSQGSAMSWDPNIDSGLGLLKEQFSLWIEHPFRSPGQAGAQLYPL